MKKTVKKYFIPHEENNYHPHILHTKRAIFYGALFVIIKAVLVVFVALLPVEAFLLPDVLRAQQQKIFTLTNELRAQKGLSTLDNEVKLTSSSQAKAEDMATLEYFSHTSPTNRSLKNFLASAGYQYKIAGENLAMGFADADQVVNAWIKSPTHYSNLIDNDFDEFGIGLESGYFDGKPTVYVAQHFGRPVVLAAAPVVVAPAPTPAPEPAAEMAPPKPAEDETVQGEKVEEPVIESSANVVGDSIPKDFSEVKALAPEPQPAAKVAEAPPTNQVVVNQAESEVTWEEGPNGTTILEAKATIAGPVASAVTYVNNYPIEMKVKGNAGVYHGELAIADPSDELFDKVIIAPSIVVNDTNGNQVNDTVPWGTVKVVSQSPFDKYIKAKKMLAPLTNIFKISQNIYLAFIVFFSLALLTSIVIEIRKQHYQVIGQTVAMLALLVWMFYI